MLGVFTLIDTNIQVIHGKQVKEFNYSKYVELYQYKAVKLSSYCYNIHWRYKAVKLSILAIAIIFIDASMANFIQIYGVKYNQTRVKANVLQAYNIFEGNVLDRKNGWGSTRSKVAVLKYNNSPQKICL